MEIYKQGTLVSIKNTDPIIRGEIICVKIWGNGVEYEIGYWRDREYKSVWLLENQFHSVYEHPKMDIIGFKPTNTMGEPLHPYAEPYYMQRIGWDITKDKPTNTQEEHSERYKIIKDDILEKFPSITPKQLKDLYPESVWGKTKLIAMLKFGCTRGQINGEEKLGDELSKFVRDYISPGYIDDKEEEPDTSGEVPSVEGSQCPKCNGYATYGEKGSLVSATPTVFKQEPDPHYSWIETHRCNGCGTVYRFKNGT